MPTWVGAFVSVFASTALAYNYNMKKQKMDEDDKIFNDEVKSVNDLIVIFNNCLSDLNKIKSTYYSKLKDSRDADRTLMYPYSITDSFSTKYINPSSISFLMTKDVVDIHDPTNPLYLQHMVGAFNSIVAIYNERNSLSRDFIDFTHKGIDEGIDSIEVINEFGLTKLKNYLIVSEKLILEVDKLIPEIYCAIFETPYIAKNYFLSKYGKKRKFIIFSSLPSEKDKDMLYDVISIDSIEEKVLELSFNRSDNYLNKWDFCQYNQVSVEYRLHLVLS